MKLIKLHYHNCMNIVKLNTYNHMKRKLIKSVCDVLIFELTTKKGYKYYQVQNTYQHGVCWSFHSTLELAEDKFDRWFYPSDKPISLANAC